MHAKPLTLTELEILAAVAEAQEGDTDAFGRIYDHFFLPMYRYTSFRAPEDLIEDIVADIFVKAWEKLHTYKLRRNVPFGAWLFRIARHTIIDAYRSQRNFEEISDGTVDPDTWNRADTETRRKELHGIVRRALEKLPRRYRDVLLLSYIAELPHREVARAMRATEGGVRVMKMRALRKLQSLIPPDIAHSA